MSQVLGNPYQITKEQYDKMFGPDAPKLDMEKIKALAAQITIKEVQKEKSDMTTYNGTITYDRDTKQIGRIDYLVPHVGVKIKKLDDRAVIPTYGTEGAAGFDFYAVGDYSIAPGQTVIVKTGLAMALPAGCYLAVVPRSGVSAKTSLRVANSPGTVDLDYRGEIGIIITNIGNDTVAVDEGYRIAQGIVAPYYQADFKVVDELDETARGAGGFGSTGVK